MFLLFLSESNVCQNTRVRGVRFSWPVRLQKSIVARPITLSVCNLIASYFLNINFPKWKAKYTNLTHLYWIAVPVLNCSFQSCAKVHLILIQCTG